MNATEILESMQSSKQNRGNGKQRAPRAKQTVYYVISADRQTLHYIGRDKQAGAASAKEHNRTLYESSSSRSLPPDVIAAVFRQNPTLADSFAAVGNQWGLSQEQTNEKRENWAKVVLAGLIQYNRLEKAKGTKGNPLIIKGGELPDGQWFVNKISRESVADTIGEDELAELFSMGDEA